VCVCVFCVCVCVRNCVEEYRTRYLVCLNEFKSSSCEYGIVLSLTMVTKSVLVVVVFIYLRIEELRVLL